MNPPNDAPPREDTKREKNQALALKLWVVLARAHAAVEKHATAHAARHELTMTEFGILEAIYHKGPMLLGEVQRRILVSSGGITYLVDRLERRGLVERRECAEDRRTRYAALTAEGEALISRIFPEHAACIEQAMSGLGRKDKRLALELLRTLGRTAADQEVCSPENPDS